jgi:hypothetical protein
MSENNVVRLIGMSENNVVRLIDTDGREPPPVEHAAAWARAYVEEHKKRPYICEIIAGVPLRYRGITVSVRTAKRALRLVTEGVSNGRD